MLRKFLCLERPLNTLIRSIFEKNDVKNLICCFQMERGRAAGEQNCLIDKEADTE